MARARVEGANWVSNWNGFVGALDGCLQALGDARHPDDLMGLSGFAFRINVHPELSPASVYLFDWHYRFSRVFDRLGYLFALHYAEKADLLFGARQKNAMDVVVRNVDSEKPLIAWNLGLPEFFVVSGYDIGSLDLVASGPPTAGDEERFPISRWGTTGPENFALIEFGERFQVDAAESAARALREAVRHAREHEHRVPDHRNGLAAYDVWAKALRSGAGEPNAVAHCAHSIAHARSAAARFLRRALDLFPVERREALAEAATRYGEVAERLRSVADAFPFPPHGATDRNGSRRRPAADAIAAAARSEAQGVAALERAFAKSAPASRPGAARAATSSRRGAASPLAPGPKRRAPAGAARAKAKAGKKVASGSASGRGRRRH